MEQMSRSRTHAGVSLWFQMTTTTSCLHVHDLTAKIHRCRRWRVTRAGHAFMSLSIPLHEEHFAEQPMTTDKAARTRSDNQPPVCSPRRSCDGRLSPPLELQLVAAPMITDWLAMRCPNFAGLSTSTWL